MIRNKPLLLLLLVITRTSPASKLHNGYNAKIAFKFLSSSRERQLSLIALFVDTLESHGSRYKFVLSHYCTL